MTTYWTIGIPFDMILHIESRSMRRSYSGTSPMSAAFPSHSLAGRGAHSIFGQLDDYGDGLVKMAYFEVPKKVGKTECAAGIILFVLILDPNPGCQVYGAAAATRQAMNVYRAACKMGEQSPLLRKRLRPLWGTNRIVKRDDPDSFYAAVAAGGDLSDGVNPAF